MEAATSVRDKPGAIWHRPAMDEIDKLRPGAERIAARTIAAALGVPITARDIEGARAKQHDFDAHGPTTIAVEVTTATDGRRRALAAALDDRENVLTRASGRSWSISLRHDASVATVAAQIGWVIEALESERLEAFGFSLWPDVSDHHPPALRHRGEPDLSPHPWTPAGRLARRLRLQSGFVLHENADHPVIVLGRPGGAATSDPEPVIEAVEDAATANAEKLALAANEGYEQCDVFLWVDHSRYDVEFALFHSDPDRARAPALPPTITGAWAGGYRPEPPTGKVTVWRYDPAIGWATVAVDVSVMGSG